MQIRQSKKDDVVILELDGRLDANTSSLFSDQLVQLIASGDKNFVIDLSQLVYISSSGLRAFLIAARQLRSNGKMVLCSLNQDVKEVFDITGFGSLFPVVASQQEALRTFQS